MYIHKDLRMHGATIMETGIFEKLVSYIENDEIRPLLAKKFPISPIPARLDRKVMNVLHERPPCPVTVDLSLILNFLVITPMAILIARKLK